MKELKGVTKIKLYVCFLCLSSATILIFIMLGCSQNGTGSEPGVAIDLSPKQASVMINSSLAFKTTVKGTDNTELSWYVNDLEGGSIETGIIQDGFYTAPSLQPLNPSVEIRCKSKSFQKAEATATIQITSPWVKTFGGFNDDQLWTVNTQAGSDYVLAGDTASFGNGTRSSWLLRLDQDGRKIWEKSYGQNAGDESTLTRAILLEKGEIVACSRIFQAEDGPVWKVSPGGALYWSKTNKDTELPYGDSVRLNTFEIKPTKDGGLVIATGINYWTAGDQYNKAYIWKLNTDGGIDWRSIFKGDRPTGNFIDQDGAYSIEQTNDNGYVIAGWLGKSSLSWKKQKECWLTTGQYCLDPPQYQGLWVTRLRPDGTPTWSKRFQTTTPSHAVLRRIPSGGFALLVQTVDLDSGDLDFWILNLNEYGHPLWQYTYGGEADDLGYDIIPTDDGGFIAVGETRSFGHGESDALVLKLRSDGSVEWAKTYGGIGDDQTFTVEPTTDGGFILAGKTNSFGAGGQDGWVLKIDPYGNVNDNCPISIDVPGIFAQPTTVEFDEINVAFEINSDALEDSTVNVENPESSVHTQCGLP